MGVGSGAWFASVFGVVWDIWGLGGVLPLKASLRRLQVSNTGDNFFLDSGPLPCLELHPSENFVSGRCHTL